MRKTLGLCSRLQAHGARQQLRIEGYDWGADGAGEVRLVVSWNRTEAVFAAMSALPASLD
jgi:hypothetical protein